VKAPDQKLVRELEAVFLTHLDEQFGQDIKSAREIGDLKRLDRLYNAMGHYRRSCVDVSNLLSIITYMQYTDQLTSSITRANYGLDAGWEMCVPYYVIDGLGQKHEFGSRTMFIADKSLGRFSGQVKAIFGIN